MGKTTFYLNSAEITVGGATNWQSAPTKLSFWFLAATSAVYIWLHIFYMNEDTKIISYADDEFCKAHLRKTKLDALATHLNQNPEEALDFNLSEVLEDLGVNSEI